MNKFLKIYCFCLLFLLLLLASTSHSNVFEVHSQNPKLKQEIEKILNSSYSKLSDFFEDSLTHPVDVFITQNDDEFDSLVGDNFPDWGIAAAVSSHNLIVLKSPSKYGYLKDIYKVTTHELAHIFLGNKVARKNIPRWLDEGFAMYMAEQWRWSLDLSIAKAVFTNSVLDLTEIDSVNAFKTSKAHLAYLESFLAVNYFIQCYGKDGFREFIQNLALGESIDSAFVNTIGLNHQGFSEEFAQHLKKRYNWISFFSESLFLWLLLAFLIVMFYFMKKLRTRKIMKKWEEEENWQEEEE